MPGPLFRGIALCAALSLITPTASFGQSASRPPAPATAPATQGFNTEQLDAMLAPIALYPDELLAQVLMASTYPLQVVEADRWLGQGSNPQLTGDALAAALGPMSWDPSVKSLVPFPQVLAMMNSKLDWLQQLGYAVSYQQPDVMNSVQRLRRQAHAAGTLATTEQQQVTVSPQEIIIQPANPTVVYVPVYNPTTAYGTWPYPTYPPVYVPPPPGYGVGSAILTGLAFAGGVAVIGSLWGWARPSWGGGYMNVNVNRYNNINVNRTAINNNVWRPPPPRAGGVPGRPPGGPVGLPARPGGLPPNAIGRPNVSVPGDLVGRLGGAGGVGNRPGDARPGVGRPGAGGPGVGSPGVGGPGVGGPGVGSPGVGRPGVGGPGIGGPGVGNPGVGRPDAGRPGSAAPGAGLRPESRPSAGQRPANVQRPTQLPSRGNAFAGARDGARAGQYANRGAQSRQTHAARPAGGGGGRAAPARGGGGGGGRHR